MKDTHYIFALFYQCISEYKNFKQRELKDLEAASQTFTWFNVIDFASKQNHSFVVSLRFSKKQTNKNPTREPSSPWNVKNYPHEEILCGCAVTLI